MERRIQAAAVEVLELVAEDYRDGGVLVLGNSDRVRNPVRVGKLEISLVIIRGFY